MNQDNAAPHAGTIHSGVMARIARSARALRSANFRLFFMGQGISLIGAWMQRIAVNWLIYRLTGSALMLGMVNFFGQLPTFLLSPYAGVLADRLDRRQALVITQVLSMAQAFLLAVLALTDVIAVWQVLALSIALGIINGFDIPVRQSFLVEMVGSREDLSNAIALNSFMVNGARLIGPAMAGVLIVLAGEGVCFLINGLSYLAVIASLLAMKLPPREAGPAAGPFRQEFRAGVRYISDNLPIRSILLLMALISLTGMPFMVLMPIIAKDILHGGAHTLGFLSSATGAGALLGAVWLASRQSVVGLLRRITASTALFGVGLILFAFSSVPWLSLALLVVVGFAMMTQMAGSNTLLQTLVDDRMRGRVMGFFAMAFMGMAPFGSLMAGGLADAIGAPHALQVCGAACLLGAIWFRRLYPRIREAVIPVYRSKGILSASDVESGETAV